MCINDILGLYLKNLKVLTHLWMPFILEITYELDKGVKEKCV